jgi:DNA-binding SARP family transcriptional activator/TolB-like protein
LQDQRFRLVTLGRLGLRSHDGTEEPSLAKRRLKLAVLAVLAVERRPVARDMLLEMFWGEQEQARARHSLSDALSHLRRVLGTAAISTRDADVAVADTAPLVVDAREFADAVARKEYGRAVALYDGPFLHCVYVAASPSFEQWVERVRMRLEAMFVKACAAHCAELAGAEQWDELGAIAARWLDAAPTSVEAATFRLNAINAAGTREGAVAALAEYERLRVRLARELDLAPDRGVAALAARIAEQVKTGDVTLAPVPEPRSAEVTAPSAGAVVPAAESSPSRPRRRTWAVLASTALLLAALAAFTVWRAPTAPVSPMTVAVLPFTVHGGPEYAYLEAGMVDLLSTNLDGAGALHAVDPRTLLARVARSRARGAPGEHVAMTPDGAQSIARGVGAGLFVLGDVVGVGGRLRVTASLYDVRRGKEAARGSAEGAPAELFALVDRLTRQLLAGYPDQSPDRLTGLAALTTTSLPALKAYLAGVSAYRAAQFDAAEAAFQVAAREDSSFALAHYQLSNALLWAARGSWDSVLNTAHRAALHASRLTPRTRLLVDGYVAFRSGDLDRAERVYRSIVRTYPDEVEAWYQLGDLLYHGNAPRGRSFVESVPAFTRVLEIEPEHLGALLHLLRIEVWEGHRAAADTLLDRAAALGTPPLRAELATLRAFAWGDAAAQHAAVAALREMPDEVVRVTAMRVALFTGDLDGAERIARLLLASTRAPEFRVVGRLQLADLALARGRRRAARAELDSAQRVAPGVVPVIAIESRALHLAQSFAHAPHEEIAAMRDTLQRWDAAVPTTVFPMWAVYNGLHPIIRRYLIGVLSVRLGDLAEADRQALALRADSASSRGEARALAAGFMAAVRAHAQATRGAPDSAVAEFERGRLAVSEGLLDAPFGNQGTDRYARAEALRALGRDDEARAWYASLGETTIDMAIFAAPAQLRLAEIAEQKGDTARAARHYGRFIELWKDADPELRPEVDEARRRLARLGGRAAVARRR